MGTFQIDGEIKLGSNPLATENGWMRIGSNMPMCLHFFKPCSLVFIPLVDIFLSVHVSMLFYKLAFLHHINSRNTHIAHSAFHQVGIWSHLSRCYGNSLSLNSPCWVWDFLFWIRFLNSCLTWYTQQCIFYWGCKTVSFGSDSVSRT